MIKAFLFDYDGVITTGVKDGIPAARLAQNLGVPLERAADLIVSVWNPYSTGQMTDAQAWERIEQQYGAPIEHEKRDIWYTWDELQPLPEMIELVRMLKAKGYKVGLLSNVLPVTAQLIRKHGGYEGFDFLVLSCEAGARKPDPKVYETALAQLEGVEPDEVVFLDDREPCVVGASNLGIRAIQVTDHAKAIEQVHEVICSEKSIADFENLRTEIIKKIPNQKKGLAGQSLKDAAALARADDLLKESYEATS